MVIKLIIISLILVAFIMLAVGIKFWFDPGVEFPSHSCAFETGETENDGSCSACQLKGLAHCPEKDGDHTLT
jgi:hypothetical protein